MTARPDGSAIVAPAPSPGTGADVARGPAASVQGGDAALAPAPVFAAPCPAGFGSDAPTGGVEVRLREVSLGYPTREGFATVLEGIDLHLAPGECLAVVGASGCGKSTLLHALAGLLQPVRGQVGVSAGARTDGGAGGSNSPAPRGRAAYMFQNDLLLPWKSVLANAAFAAELAHRAGRPWLRRAGSSEALESIRERALTLLREFDLEDALHLYPHQLSGGMRQRVALARTLALGRGLILLDEPFGSLDALTRSDLRGWMARVMETHPATWVLVTHDVDEAVHLADRVVVLGGRPAVIRGSADVALARGRRAGRDDHITEAGLRRAAAEVRGLLEEGRTR
ncbi:MAG: ABC transporter ATP-binding protein [Thermoleophilia bacterium]